MKQALSVPISSNGSLIQISATRIWLRRASSTLPTWFRPYCLCLYRSCSTSCSATFNWKTITIERSPSFSHDRIGNEGCLIGLIGGIIAGVLLYVFHLYIVKDVKKNGKAIVVALLMEAGTLAIIPFGPAFNVTTTKNTWLNNPTTV